MGEVPCGEVLRGEALCGAVLRGEALRQGALWRGAPSAKVLRAATNTLRAARCLSGFAQPDFKQFRPILTGDEQAVTFGVVGDTVQHVGLSRDDV
jgi:hypothetical protein